MSYSDLWWIKWYWDKFFYRYFGLVVLTRGKKNGVILRSLQRQYSFGNLETLHKEVLEIYRMLISLNIFKTSAKHDVVYDVLVIPIGSYATLVPKTRIIVPVSHV